MKVREIIGLNTKWYRYQLGLTQEEFWNKSKFKMSYISTIETGDANLTADNIEIIAKILKINPVDLFNVETAKLAKKLPLRVDTYKKTKGKK